MSARPFARHASTTTHPLRLALRRTAHTGALPDADDYAAIPGASGDEEYREAIRDAAAAVRSTLGVDKDSHHSSERHHGAARKLAEEFFSELLKYGERYEEEPEARGPVTVDDLPPRGLEPASTPETPGRTGGGLL